MKKKHCNIIVYALCIMALIFCNTNVAEASNEYATISGGGTIDKGDTVKVILRVTNNTGMNSARGTITYDASVVEIESAGNATISGSGGSFNFSQGFDGETTSEEFTFKFKGVGSGKASISMKKCYITNSSGNEINSSGGIAVIKVNDSDDSSSDKKNDSKKSTDSKLSKLTVSTGTLSPEFKSDTYEYTLDVKEDVTSVDIEATPNDKKAKVGEIKGADSLEVGENVVEISVEAEDGSKTNYFVTINRAKAAQENNNDNKDEENTDNQNASSSIEIDGNNYYISSSIPKDTAPADFKESTAQINGEKVSVLNYNNGNLKLVYLINLTSKEGKLFVYNEDTQKFYPFIKASLSSERYIILMQARTNVTIPGGFIESTVNIGGNNFDAYTYAQKNKSDTSGTSTDISVSDSSVTGSLFDVMVVNASNTASQNENVSDSTAVLASGADTAAGEFYFVYAIDNEGTENWYQYDSIQGTYQRCNSYMLTSLESTQKDLQSAETASQKYKNSSLIFKIIAAILLLCIIGILILFKDKLGDIKNIVIKKQSTVKQAANETKEIPKDEKIKESVQFKADADEKLTDEKAVLPQSAETISDASQLELANLKEDKKEKPKVEDGIEFLDLDD